MRTIAKGSALGAVCLSMGIAAHQQPAFHAEARLVVLHVAVTNDRGERVTNLNRESFEVYEDGRLQPIAFFSSEDVPASVGLVIDNSGSMRSLRPRVEAAALAFVRSSHPLDEVFILNFADTPRIDVSLTNDPLALEAGIRRVDAIGGTAMRDALLAAERYVREHARYDRHALLVITDGNDNASTVSRPECRRVVERSSTAIYGVRLERDASSNASGGSDEELDRLAELTGGTADHIAVTSNIEQVVQEVARRIRNEYTIAYTPAKQALDGSYRAVRVRVTRPAGLRARTRAGYWAMPSRTMPP